MAVVALQPIVLYEEASSQPVLVVPSDRDKLVLSVADAVAACSEYSRIAEWREQFRELLETLSTWITSHQSSIRCAYLTIKQGGDLLFVVVQKEVAFDEKLSENLTELDLKIANSDEFRSLHVDVLAIPRVSGDSTAAFLSSGPVLKHA